VLVRWESGQAELTRAANPGRQIAFPSPGHSSLAHSSLRSRPLPGGNETDTSHYLIYEPVKTRVAKQALEELLTPLHDHHILNSMVNDSAEQLTTVFLALADPTRRAILERLAHGEASGTELAQPFSISVPAISKHLRVLEHADLILHRKDGRTHRFRLAARPMREAATWLERYRHFWEAQLDSLDTYLQVTSEEEQESDDLPNTS
jgi:DNA-binding transcriptional ArsR family regulator